MKTAELAEKIARLPPLLRLIAVALVPRGDKRDGI
jgi:hypothetical protein